MRYSRQTTLLEIGEEGAQRLLNSCVAIIGLGATGSVSAELLVRAGIGKVILIDYDVVQLSNLQRQSLYEEADVGLAKVHAALTHLKKINSDVEIIGFVKQLNLNTLQLIDEVDLVLDCTDNMQTRFLLNEYCHKQHLAWIYCGAIETRGAVAFFDRDACFECIFDNKQSQNSCDDAGILSMASHSAASLQCAQAIRYLVKEEHNNTLLQFDVWNCSFETIQLKKKKNCAVCEGTYRLLEGKEFVEFCLSKQCVKVRPNKERHINSDTFKIVKELDCAVEVLIEGIEVLVHDGGALEIKTKNIDVARKIANQIWD